MEDLHFRRKIAGMPSGPAAEFEESSVIAVMISLALNSMLLIVAPGMLVLLILLVISDGDLKTDLNCVDSISAISLEFEVSTSFLLRSGPTEDFILDVRLANAWNSLGFDLIDFSARCS